MFQSATDSQLDGHTAAKGSCFPQEGGDLSVAVAALGPKHSGMNTFVHQKRFLFRRNHIATVVPMQCDRTNPAICDNMQSCMPQFCPEWEGCYWALESPIACSRELHFSGGIVMPRAIDGAIPLPVFLRQSGPAH